MHKSNQASEMMKRKIFSQGSDRIIYNFLQPRECLKVSEIRPRLKVKTCEDTVGERNMCCILFHPADAILSALLTFF